MCFTLFYIFIDNKIFSSLNLLYKIIVSYLFNKRKNKYVYVARVKRFYHKFRKQIGFF